MPTRNTPFWKHAAGGVTWLTIQNVVQRLASFGGQIVLARLLSPHDYGEIGLAYTVVAIAGAIVGFGVDDVLLQRGKAMGYWTGPAFAVSLILGLLSMAVVIAISPVAAHLYKTPDLVGLLTVLAVGMPITAVATIPYVAARRDLRFGLISAIGAAELIGQTLLTILFAWLHFGPYSFVIPIPVVAVLRALYLWRISPMPLKFNRLFRGRYLMSKGSAVFGHRVVTSVVGQGDYFVLGLMASPSVVGTYYFAFRLSIQTFNMLAANFQNVLFSLLSLDRNDPSRQTRTVLQAAEYMNYILLPICFMQAVLIEPLVNIVFGAKWQAAIPMIQMLSIGGPFEAAAWLAGALLSARGQFHRTFLYTLALTPVFFAFVLVGAKWRLAFGVAAGVSIYYVISGLSFFVIVMRDAGARMTEIVEVYGRPLVISGLSVGAAYGLGLWPAIRHANVARIAVVGASGVLIYAVLLRTLAPQIFSLVLTKLREMTPFLPWPVTVIAE